MPDGRRFEDKLTIEDLIKLPQKELTARIYQQVLRTNGTVSANCIQIEEMKADIKLRATCADVTELRAEVKDKIGMKLFVILTSIIGLLLLTFNIWDRLASL